MMLLMSVLVIVMMVSAGTGNESKDGDAGYDSND